MPFIDGARGDHVRLVASGAKGTRPGLERGLVAVQT